MPQERGSRGRKREKIESVDKENQVISVFLKKPAPA
jgi:hypothetical protein